LAERRGGAFFALGARRRIGAEKPANSGLAGKNVTGQHEIPRQNRLGGEKQPTETQENPPKSFEAAEKVA